MRLPHSFAPFIHSLARSFIHSFIHSAITCPPPTILGPAVARDEPRQCRPPPGFAGPPVALSRAGACLGLEPPPRALPSVPPVPASRRGSQQVPRLQPAEGRRPQAGTPPAALPLPRRHGNGLGAEAGQVEPDGGGQRGSAGPAREMSGTSNPAGVHTANRGRNAQSDHQRALIRTMHHLIHFCNLNCWGPPPSKPIFDIGVFSSPPPFPFEMPPPPSPSRSLSSEPRSLILDEYYFALFVGQAQLCYWR